MSTEENKAIIRRHVEEFWNQGKLDVAGELHATDYVFHDSTSPEMRGTEAYNQFAITYLTAFPDLHFTIEDLIAAGDQVVQRWSCVGTHQGELMGIPASGKPVSVANNAFGRIEGGKIAEWWSCPDTMGMMRQIGAIH